MGQIVVVDLDEMILGRALSNPIHDSSGVLLLAAGITYDAHVKSQLKQRGIHKILISEEDFETATIQGASQSYEVLEQQLDDRVDAMIREGRLVLRNTGPAVRNSVVQHGRKNYDPETSKKVAEQHKAARNEMQRLVSDVAQGREIHGGTVNSLADGFANSLMADVAGTVHQALAGPTDSQSSQHSVTVATLAMSIGIELGMDSENLRILGIAAMLQNLGMSRVPSEIREAPRVLNAVEFLEIEKHVLYTADMLETISNIPDIVQVIAYQSHERIDGSGYPRRRQRSCIHYHARVLHVADTYVALTSRRPHRGALTPYCAIECILQLVRQGRLEAAIVHAMLQSISLFPIGSYVVLSDGSLARVLRANGPHFTQPIVLRLQDGKGQPTDIEDDREIIDLCDSEWHIVQAIPTPHSDEINVRFDNADGDPDSTKAALARFLLQSGHEREQAANERRTVLNASARNGRIDEEPVMA